MVLIRVLVLIGKIYIHSIHSTPHGRYGSIRLPQKVGIYRRHRLLHFLKRPSLKRLVRPWVGWRI